MSTVEPSRPPGSAVPDADRDAAVLREAERAVEPLGQRVDMTPLDFPRRLLLVHAHPDDETIGTGATMARYAAEGALVTLVTCTLGEEGEVLVPELAHLAADRDDRLGEHRVGELATAMEALGVRDHRFLGGPGRWRDSGMMGTPANDREDAFWRADLQEAAGELVAVIRETRPQVVVTYGPDGGYGHPDHIQAHRVTVRAIDAAADPSYAPGSGEVWQVAKLYHAVVPRSVLQAGIDLLREREDSPFAGVTSAEELPFGVPDEVVTTEVDGRDHLDAKVAAMRAHRTQISVDGGFFALADNVGQRAFGREYYVLARGQLGDRAGEHGRESDLFAGVTS